MAPHPHQSDTQESKHALREPEHEHATAGSVPANATNTDTAPGSEAYAVSARGIQVNGEEGPAYGPLDVNIPAQGLTILSGRGGSGRTALALTISGRMSLDEGKLNVLGYTKQADIRNHVAIAGVDEIDAIDRNVKVRDVFTEHKVWSSLWISWQRPADEAYVEKLCGQVYDTRDLPPLDVYVSQISGLDRILIRICLALHPAHSKEIKMLVMDDLEQVRELEDRMVLLEILERISQKIPVVVNAVNPLPDHIQLPHHDIELFTDVSHLQPKHTGLLRHFERHNRQQAEENPSAPASETENQQA